MTPDAPLLEVDGLSLTIGSPDGDVQVLDGASLTVRRGRVMGLVGESGCGKSTLVRSILGVLPPTTRITGGGIRLDGEDLLALDDAAMTRRVRGRLIGFVPQDPYLALNPLFTIEDQLLEIFRWHAPEGGARSWRKAGRDRIVALFEKVRLPDPTSLPQRYPHQLSGGQRQRVLIAAALLCRPRLIVADEPTTALDVTTQQQILRLMAELVTEFDVTILFVTHDFGVVAELCQEITVMYAGQTVETGAVRTVLRDPGHPYTRRLIACHPDRLTALEGIPGTVPSLVDPPSGCRFHTRCDVATGACPGRPPRLVPLGHGHAVNCIHAEAAG